METSDNKEIKTNRDRIKERLQKKYAEDKFEDDDSIFGRIAEDYDGMEGELSKYGEESKKLTDLFDKDPRAASFLLAWKNGQSPIEFILENFGDDFRAALDDPNKKDEFAKAHAKWLEKVAKSSELEKECDDNLEASFNVLKSLQEEHGWSDEQATSIFDAVHQIILDGIYNKITPETYLLASKALNFDQAVSDAAQEAELRGRNAKIEEKISKTQPPADIPPSLGGTGAGAGEEKPAGKKRYNPFIVADEE